MKSEIFNNWRGIPTCEWPSDIFEKVGLRNPYVPGNMTLRLEALMATRHVDGAVVECGVYQGQGLATLGCLMRETNDRRLILGFDSFRGSPQPTSKDAIDGQFYHYHKPDYFTNTSEEEIRNLLKALELRDKITLIPGFFHETLPSVSIQNISLLILDCDLYESYKTCLSILYPKVQQRGWIIFDEYFSPKYPGARFAVDEFFSDKPEKPVLAKHLLAEHPYERWYVLKT